MLQCYVVTHWLAHTQKDPWWYGRSRSSLDVQHTAITWTSAAILLTHLPLNKMTTISQTIFSDAFLWMKMFEFRLKFHWSLFLRFQLTIFQHWFRYWLGAVQATSHYLNQWWLDYRRIYASLGLNELTGLLGTIFSEIWINIQNFCLRKCIWKCHQKNILTWQTDLTYI